MKPTCAEVIFLQRLLDLTVQSCRKLKGEVEELEISAATVWKRVQPLRGSTEMFIRQTHSGSPCLAPRYVAS